MKTRNATQFLAVNRNERRRPTPRIAVRAGSLLLLRLWPATAGAHTETGIVGGALSGFLHPLTGLDHLVAIGLMALAFSLRG